MALPPPATGVEMYLAAILDELKAIRGLLGRGGRQVEPEPASDEPQAVSSQPQSPTRRTRTRAR